MPLPSIEGTGATLRKNGASPFWIVGTNISIGDDVEIKVGGVLWWKGDIKARAGDKFRALVDYVGPSIRTGGDLEDVTVTVTNSTGPSPEHDDEVVVDGP
jgi:hypothetical protein